MESALSIREQDWWPFREETVTDLLEFLGDSDGFAVVTADPLPASNDNWPLRMGSCRADELPPRVIWNPRFRTAD